MADVAESIEESGRRIGHHAWVETRLFELLGRWSATAPDPRTRALLASQSRHHAWHVELWHSLLPALPHLPATSLVVPDEAGAALIASIEPFVTPADEARPSSAGDEGSARALDGLEALYHDALPRLIAAYTDHLDHTTVVTDGPTIRVLRLVIGDLADDRAAGEALVARHRAGATTA